MLCPIQTPQDVLRSAGLTHVELTTLARFFFDALTQAEIADADDCSQPTVAARLKRALAKLARARLPVPRRAPRHERRAHRPTCEAVDPGLLDRVRPAAGGRFRLGARRLVDSAQREVAPR